MKWFFLGLLVGCQTASPEIRIIDCQEQLHGAEIKWARKIKDLRDKLAECLSEIDDERD